MDLRALDEPQPLEICLVDDIHVLAGWEYWLKLSYFTADLHIVRAWSLNSRVTEVSFESQARALRGAIVYSFLDADRLSDPKLLDEGLKERRFQCDWTKQVFPTGALEAPVCFSACPTGTFRVLLCKLATGSTLAHQESEGDFETREIPGAYSSLARIESSPSTNETKMLRILYRVKKSSQVLPSMVLEFAFQSLLIEVSQPMCEVCELLPATLFCPADRAHLCDECDEIHHSSTRLLARHKRLPVTHSPFQFGQCPNHPSEMIDCVCMVCFLALCPHCILIGHHSAADFSEHPLISTLDAYKMSMQGTSPSEEALQIRREKILKNLQDNHRLLSRLHANFASVHRRIDDSNKALMKQLQSLKHRQVGFLQAVKRELLTECLIIEWMEAFFAHLRLALCPSDYLTYHHRHDLLAADLFGGPVRVEVGLDVLPPWVSEKIFIEGGFRVTTAPFAIPELRMSRVAEDSLLQVFLTGVDKTGKTKMKIVDADTTQEATDEEADEEDDTGDGEVAVGQWAVLPGAPDEAAPGPRVHALSRVLLFPDEPATKGLTSQKQKEQLEQEEFVVLLHTGGIVRNFVGALGETTMRAQPDRDKLPPQILQVIDEASREAAEGNHSEEIFENPLNTIPKEFVHELWTVASDLDFRPILIVLKAADAMRLPELLRNVCIVACYMKDAANFLRKLIEHELCWVSHMPESLFLSTSSLCGCLFDNMGLHARLFFQQEDRQWISTLLGAPLGALSRGWDEKPNQPEEELLYPVLSKLIDRLTETDFLHIPSTIRSLLYILTDCIDANAGFGEGLPRVLWGPPNPTNTVSAAAVFTCCQVLLARLLASYLQLLRSEALASSKETVAAQPLSLQVPPTVSGKTAAQVAHDTAQQRFFDRRSLRSISVLDGALRHLGAFCSDAAVSSMLLSKDKHRQTKNEAGTAELLKDREQSLQTHPDHRFYATLATKVTTWMRKQLELPRLHSPLVLCGCQKPYVGEQAAKRILDYICHLDGELKRGEYKSKTGIKPEEIYSPHFEKLVHLALTVAARKIPKMTRT